jgi:hypothetical protein
MPFDVSIYDEPTVLSLDTLIAWLRTKNPAESYAYVDGSECLLFQYLKAHGFPVRYVTAFGAWYDHEGALHRTSRAFYHIAIGHPTFGAALQRASEQEEQNRSVDRTVIF